MKCLITGVTGFAGGHLATELLHRGYEVCGLSRSGRSGAGDGHVPERAAVHSIDLHDREKLRDLMAAIRPERIYHLAGFASPGKSFRDADGAWRGNLDATRRLYEAVKSAELGRHTRILAVSSGLIYGDPVGGGSVCREETPFCPASPYAASKAAMDSLSYQVARTEGLHIVRARPFSHIGPGQSADYAAANFARQIAWIEAGLIEPAIRTGDLGGWRDLTDVRDVCRAYVDLLEQGESGEAYNIASGTTYRIRAVLESLVSLTAGKIRIIETPDPARATETAVTQGDSEKLRRLTGWQPKIDLTATLHDMLNYWRRRTTPPSSSQ